MASSSPPLSRNVASPQSNSVSLDHIRQMLLTPPSSRPPEFENPLEKIEQLLTCPICLDRYKQPKLLPCHHTFCLPCLDNCADVVHRILKCPECRAEHPLPYDGVKSFQTNYTLTGFLDIHLQATDENAAQLEAYIQRYNLERCKICDEKATLELCAHCERRACADCRNTHMEMLKRDLNRMLNQVKRLSNRITEASDGLSKGAELLTLNCETTKDEVREYFRRYYRELKKKEELFIQEIETFHSTETRLMRNLRDILEIESSNMSEGCAYLEAALKGEREVEDAELAKLKNIFSEGLEYLRNFQPDAEELFSKKLRFSPGDDASKLPTAIANFGELTVSLPQFAGRYLPLEQSYLPRPMRIGYESDNYKYSSRRCEAEESRAQNDIRSRYSARNDDDIMSIRYRRRQQMEEEAWNRLRANGDSGQVTSAHNHTPGNSPWSRAVVASGVVTPVDSSGLHIANNLTAAAVKVAAFLQPSTQNTPIRNVDNQVAITVSSPSGQSASTNQQSATLTTSTKITPQEVEQEIGKSAEVPKSTPTQNGSSTVASAATSSGSQSAAPQAAAQLSTVIAQTAAFATTPANATTQQETVTAKSGDTVRAITRRAAPVRQTSSDDASLNEKVENIRAAHEKRRLRNRTIAEASVELKTNSASTQSSEESESDNDRPPVLSHSTGNRFRIICRSTSGAEVPKVIHAASIHQISDNTAMQTITEVQPPEAEPLPIPIVHYPDSTTQRFVPPPQRQESTDASNTTDTDAPQPTTTSMVPHAVPDRRARFRRRASAMAAGREASNEARLTKMLPSKFLCTVDYQSKSKPRLVFGKKGSKEGDLNWPRGVTAICGTEFAVCDSSNHRVCIFNTQGRLLRAFGKYGTGDGQLDSAAGICCNRFRQLIVSDRYNHRIVIFDQLGQFIKSFGGHGPSSGRFNNPWGVCVDETGIIYAVDKDNHRVQVFDSNGQFVSKFGSMGPGPGQLHNPQFIAYHKQTQQLYVTDSSNHRVSVFDHNGNPVFQFGQEGFHNGQLKFPRGIAVDDQGFIIVADSGNNRVQIFYPDGRFMRCFGTWGNGPGQLKGLEDVTICDKTIIVSDRENHRIQLF